jgi:hypothetical protein
MSNHFPYDIYTLDSFSLSYHALARFKQLLCSDNISADIAEKIEDDIIPALEYIEGWEPTDDMISAHIESRGVF